MEYLRSSVFNGRPYSYLLVSVYLFLFFLLDFSQTRGWIFIKFTGMVGIVRGWESSSQIFNTSLPLWNRNCTIFLTWIFRESIPVDSIFWFRLKMAFLNTYNRQYFCSPTSQSKHFWYTKNHLKCTTRFPDMLKKEIVQS